MVKDVQLLAAWIHKSVYSLPRQAKQKVTLIEVFIRDTYLHVRTIEDSITVIISSRPLQPYIGDFKGGLKN